MSRIARVVAVGVPHHVTQRGNYGQTVFHSDEDRRVYLALLAHHGTLRGLSFWGFCLMSNHVHLIVVPQREDSLARVIGPAHWRYAQYLHGRHGLVGHLWQNRFYSCPLGPAHAVLAMRYVERNPVRAGMVSEACAYAWSSARSHVGGTDPHGILDLEAWRRLHGDMEWNDLLANGESEEELHEIAERTRKGRPYGDRAFSAALGAQLGRNVEARPAGRPRRTHALAGQMGLEMV
jgi:putative transposase